MMTEGERAYRMYKVIRYFTDAQDNEYAYNVGDVYPRKGHTVSKSRINDLLSGNNFQKVPLIALDKDAVINKTEEPKEEPKEEPQAEPSVEWTSEEIDKMPFMKLKSIAKKNGVDVTEKKADEIRSELKERLGL